MDEPPENTGADDDSPQSEGDTQPLKPISERDQSGADEGEPDEPPRPPAAVLREAGANRPAPRPPILDETDRVRLLPEEPEPAAWRIILQTLHPGTTRIGLNVWQELVIGRLESASEDDEAPDLDMSPHRAAALGVSRRHAALVPRADGLFLVDLHSTNGTWVNGTYLPPGQRHRLKPGDKIELGLLRLAVRSVSPLKRSTQP